VLSADVRVGVALVHLGRVLGDDAAGHRFAVARLGEIAFDDADVRAARAARRAYRVMLRAAQALAWERHRRRFRVQAAAPGVLLPPPVPPPHSTPHTTFGGRARPRAPVRLAEAQRIPGRNAAGAGRPGRATRCPARHSPRSS
jgi:hypothetical protein